MNAVTLAHKMVAEAHGLNDAALMGLTEEQFSWLPPPTANPIKSTLLHMLAGEDLFIQAVLQGGPPLWATGGWGERIGLAQAPGGGQGWAEARAAGLELAPVLAYGEAVCGATEAYLARLTEEELDRTVNFFGRDATVADVLARFAAHTAGHAGEIAALRGMQGAQGLPF